MDIPKFLGDLQAKVPANYVAPKIIDVPGGKVLSWFWDEPYPRGLNIGIAQLNPKMTFAYTLGGSLSVGAETPEDAAARAALFLDNHSPIAVKALTEKNKEYDIYKQKKAE